jgi:hypothetical protein
MTRTVLKWTRRLVLLAIAATVVVRVLESTKGGGGEPFPSIGGDTWPPVPVNPDRRG